MPLKKQRRQIPEEIIFGICERFIEGMGASEIARWVKSQGYECNREQVYYPWLKRGIERGFLRLCPPQDLRMAQDLSSKYASAGMDFRVVNVRGEHPIDRVGLSAADLIASLVMEIGSRQDEVHIGFGAGNTVRIVAKNLALRLKSESSVPPLVIHSLSAGFDVEDLTTAPNSFFSYYKDLDMKLHCVGLFAPPIMEWDEYDKMKARPGVAESFRAAEKIDIVVTSLGNYVSDPHSTLRKYMELSGEERSPRGRSKKMVLDEKQCIGDVMWRPYSGEGPIMDRTPWRAVTVLELDELRRRASERNHHVVMVAGPCNRCGESKTVALRPLLTVPELRVCNHMVIDIASARELLQNPSD